MSLDIDNSKPSISSISLQEQQKRIVLQQEDITKLQTNINQNSTVGEYESDGEFKSDYERHIDTNTDHLDIEDNNHYQKTLKIISVKKRDDGRFGLNAQSSTIGGFPYTVYGNRLRVDIGSSKRKKSFVIEDPDVWKWLIIRNPRIRNQRIKAIQSGRRTYACVQRVCTY